VSLPVPASIISPPSPPYILSSPLAVLIILPRPFPTTISFPEVPITFSIPLIVSV